MIKALIVCVAGAMVSVFIAAIFVFQSIARYREAEIRSEAEQGMIVRLMAYVEAEGRFPNELPNAVPGHDWVSYTAASDGSAAVLVTLLGNGISGIAVLTQDEAILLNTSGEWIGKAVSWCNEQTLMAWRIEP